MRYRLIVIILLLVGCSDPSTKPHIPAPEENLIIELPQEKAIPIDTEYVDEYTQSGWTITFRDEFDQSELSTIRWNKVNDGYKDYGRLHYYLPEQVSIASENLILNVDNNAYGDFPFRSGAVTTKGKHEQLYGKFEIRAKLPSGQGLFPAIWLLPSDGKAYPEIDIVEMLGQLTNEIWHVAHKEAGNREFKLTEGIDGSEWHVYTLDWLEEELIFYIDSKEQFRTPNISNTSMYLWMNVAVGGVWVGDPDEQTIFPASMEVDYVRIYSKNKS